MSNIFQRFIIGLVLLALLFGGFVPLFFSFPNEFWTLIAVFGVIIVFAIGALYYIFVERADFND